jgi:hypothetical protein
MGIRIKCLLTPHTINLETALHKFMYAKEAVINLTLSYTRCNIHASKNFKLRFLCNHIQDGNKNYQ